MGGSITRPASLGLGDAAPAHLRAPPHFPERLDGRQRRCGLNWSAPACALFKPPPLPPSRLWRQSNL